MKKIFAILAMLAPVVVATVVYAASYGVISMSKPGLHEPVGFGVARIDQVECRGSAVAAGIVELSSVSADGAYTNLLIAVTNSSGSVSVPVANSTLYYVAGEKLLWSGTATNGAVRIIVSQ